MFTKSPRPVDRYPVIEILLRPNEIIVKRKSFVCWFRVDFTEPFTSHREQLDIKIFFVELAGEQCIDGVCGVTEALL